jgi:uncharacterized protein
MYSLVNYIAQQLVDRPEDVVVSVVNGDDATIFKLSVAKDDLEKILGKDGCNAGAIRTLLTAVYSKSRKKKVVLEIEE